jgi:hypothetical protein
MYVLGYDIGSSSVKASLVNVESGKCAASAFFPKTEAPILAVKQGWAEQDPQSWWDNLKLATSRSHGFWCKSRRNQSYRYFLSDARSGLRGQEPAGTPPLYYMV